MGPRPVQLTSASLVAVVLAAVCVFFPGPVLQPVGDESATSDATLLQLEARLYEDEASFMQLSDAVTRRSLGDQRIHGTGAAAESAAAKERRTEVHSAAILEAKKETLTAVQLGSADAGRKAGSAQDRVRRTRDPMMAVTIIVFALCGVALLLIFFKLYTDRDEEDDWRASQYKKMSPGQMYRPPQSPGIAAQSPGMQYSRPQTGEFRQTSPQMSQTLPPTGTMPMSSGDPGYGGGYRPASVDLAPGSQGSSSSPFAPSKMSSELHGAIVPAKRKFIVKVPSLLVDFPKNTEVSRTYEVNTKDNIQMLNLKVLRYKPHTPQNPDSSIEEYMTLSMPPELDKELVVCTFGHVEGNTLTCEIYKSDYMAGSKLYGILQEEPSDSRFGGASTQGFALWLATEPAVKLLSILVVGRLAERKVKVLDGRNPSTEVASTVPVGATASFYETECYPHSDVLLVVLALAGVDRLVANSGGRSGFTTEI
mmetsp:Transcript_142182/g.247809  ORF Transcript_142182/g.247809 Transcript_142182/m.247809 type:complete len:480 (-) Transcript_142182:167-1606(-)